MSSSLAKLLASNLILSKFIFLLRRFRDPSAFKVIGSLPVFLVIDNFLNNFFLSCKFNEQMKVNRGYCSINKLSPLQSISPAKIYILV